MEKTILLVDDSASMRTTITIALAREGFHCISAHDGRDALDKLSTGEKVHLIISDVNMPIMGGLEFLKAVKTNPKYKFTPVIMLTTESSDEMKNEGRALGARAWVVKPFTPDKLVDAAKRLCLP
jgi:two-component system chemotaxis response regulator CheY